MERTVAANPMAQDAEISTGELRLYRYLLLAVAILYPSWYYIFTNLVPGANDSLVGRASIGVIALLAFLQTFRPAYHPARAAQAFTIVCYCLTAQYFYMLFDNHVHMSYVLGSYIVTISVCGSMRTIKAGLLYATFAMTLVLATVSMDAYESELVSMPLYVFGQATVLIVTNTLIAGRSAMLRRLDNKRRQLVAQREELAEVNVALAKEIRDREEAEAMLLESAKMAALGEMAGSLAHEINNPLTIIQWRTEILRMILTGRAPEAAANAVTHVDSIQATTERIARIIHGLKTFARSGERDPLLPTSLKTLIDITLPLCAERLYQSDVRLEVQDRAQGGALLRCRETQMSQVLINLINNACDALLREQDRWIVIELAGDDRFVEIAFVNGGVPIPREIRSKIFEPFFTTKEVGRGTGLGLSVAKGIVEDHGGSIGLDENSLHTRFVIRLPRLAQSPQMAS